MEKKRFNINLDDSAFTKERAPVKPLFQPSSKAGQSAAASSSSTTSETTAQPAPPSAGQPLSYAEFIVQSKGHAPPRVPSAPQRVGVSRVAAGTGTGIDTETGSLKQGLSQGAQGGPDVLSSSSSVGCERPQDQAQGTKDLGSGGPPGVTEGEGQRAGTEQKQGEGQGSEGSNILGHPKPVGSGNSIIVSPRQRGNPILKFVRSVPWEFGEVVPDYVLGQTTCALFLSLRYHNLNPNYIHDRLKLLGQTFILRVLLVLVDVKDPHHSLKELARICIMADCTLILSWSPEEAGRYLETYKSYEKKPADLLKEHVEKDYLSKVTDCLTTVKSVNKTDSITLLSTFSSLEGIINAAKEDLVLCPGLGPQKARRLYDVLHQPFLKAKKKDS
ncbi:DNA excision repair protein ERCC-1 [Salvelinus namaycush]|uniref:DNA excision repair protein ERCC-1 n=1 Tax=Salvelinus namaycush TaxID=8040 RepID=A0A8U1F5U3_SALNM|nr:DNA excision repair protein ERCC-1 [Salvelinus namaycush]